jgi:phenylpyruvate tautomerase PptA (4-oxalocrotonate tautomerase family)
MPCIEAKLSLKLTDGQKQNLQQELTTVVSDAFSKPKQYIMVNLADAQTLYLGENQLDKGAYIAISLLGAVAKPACQKATQEICRLLQKDFGIAGADVYVTYHPVELWGWNGSMF